MRFACPYCQTKYQIPAEKLTAGVVRVQCKVCTKIIAVRNPKSAGSGGSKADQPVPHSVDPNQHWHFVKGEERTGPHPKEVLEQAIQSGEITADTHAWRPGMDSWEQLKNIADFQNMIAAPPSPPPRASAASTQPKAEERGQKATGKAPRAPGGQVRRGSRFTRVGAKTRTPGNAPTGAPRSRVVGPTRRFPAPGTPGAPPRGTSGGERPYLKGAKEDEARVEEQVLQTPVSTEEKVEAPVSPSAPTLFAMNETMAPPQTEENADPSPAEQNEEALSPVTDETETNEVEESLDSPPSPSAEETEEEQSLTFDATLPEGALDNLAGDLDDPDEESTEFGATLEDQQLSLLAGDLDRDEEAFIPQIPAVKESDTLASDPIEEESAQEFEDHENNQVLTTDEEPVAEPDSESEESQEEEILDEEILDDENREEDPTAEDALAEEESDSTSVDNEDSEPAEESEEDTDSEEERPEPEVDESSEDSATLISDEEDGTSGEEEDIHQEADEGESSSAGETPETADDSEEEDEELILGQEETENSLELDDPSNPQTAGPTLPFHLDEDARTSLDDLFSPLDSEPVPPDSIIQPFSRERTENPSEEEEVFDIQKPTDPASADFEEPLQDEASAPGIDDESTILDGAPSEVDTDEKSDALIQDMVVLDEDEEDDDGFLETDFFAVDDENADEDSLSFEFAPPELPSKEEIRESKNELKKLMSEAAEESKKEDKSQSSEDVKRAKEEVKKLGMDAPSSRPSGKRLSLVAAAIIGVIVLLVIVSSQDDEAPAPPPPVSVESEKVFDKGELKRPSYEKPVVEKTVAEVTDEAPAVEEETEEEEEEAVPAWKANFGDDEEETVVTKKKRSKSSASTDNSGESKGTQKKEGKPLDNRALAGLMGKDDGANLKGLKEDTKKALSGMKTATEVSSDVLNKLFLKRSPQIKRCASRHNLTGKVVVKFAVAMSGATSNTQVIATPTPPTSDGIQCIEKIVNGWKFPPQDQETLFSKILVF